MPTFSGINHVALTVTDLDRSQRFYTGVLGFLAVLDVGYGRVCMHTGTGFTVALVTHEHGSGGRFSEGNTGLDHLGMAAASREELVEWERRLDDAGVEHSPIQDRPLGYHLNFRDPDGIALEFQAPTAMYAAALENMRVNQLPDSAVLAAAAEMMGEEMVAEQLV